MQGADDGLRDGIARNNAKCQDEDGHGELPGTWLIESVPRLYPTLRVTVKQSIEKTRLD